MFATARRINDKKFLEKLVNDLGYSVIDTRSPVEYRNGTLFNAPNAPLRNFLGEFARVLKDSNKVVLIGSEKDEKAFQACIRYAEQNAKENTKISYYYYH